MFRPFLVASLAALLVAGHASAGAVLDRVRAAGLLRCGVNTGLAGFSIADAQGRWTGLDAEFCRLVAAAVLGDAEKVRFVPLSAQQRFSALQSGDIDLLSRNTTWTASRDAGQGMVFVETWYHDGQGFMVPTALGVASAAELDGAAICVQSGTTTELNLTDWFRARGLSFTPVVFEGFEESQAAFFGGRCQAYTTDASGLAALRATEASNPDEYAILPEVISREPLGPAVPVGDPEWFAIVRWSLFAAIEAEELGITRASLPEAMGSQDPAIRRFLGLEGDIAQRLGLPADWTQKAIGQVGNYAEIYERSVGQGSPLKLPRGRNALARDGGLMHAPPFR